MTVIDVVILLIVAGVCGSLGRAISGYSHGGCLVSIALGFIGALLGMWLARQLGLPELFAVNIGDTKFPIIWSIIGSALFVAVISLISRRRRESCPICFVETLAKLSSSKVAQLIKRV
jgi:uncharacterized membrane protein YeaQ/YmgE (transglycosylase-associated protein family)